MSTQHPIAFDASPLTAPVDGAAVRAFSREQRALRSHSAGAVLSAVIFGVIIVMFVVVGLPLMVGGITAALHAHNLLIALPFVGVATVFVIIGVIAFTAWRRGRIASYRLSRFAAANSMSYLGRVDNPPLPGMIFHLGSSRNATDLVRGTSPRFVEFGNHSYTVKSGKNSTTYTWGYVAVKLDVPLPNIVLDAIGNNTLFGSNLPARFDRDQKLSLEGDFDQHFQLYCPEGYERDALYLFTPDIMARFIDNAAELDAEIVDDWLFLYSKRKLSTLDPATWAWLFSVVGALMTKFDQWARWRDDRLLLEHPSAAPTAAPAPFAANPAAAMPAMPDAPAALPFAPPAGMLRPPPGVAKQGRRLKRSMGWVPIVVIVALFTMMALRFWGGMH